MDVAGDERVSWACSGIARWPRRAVAERVRWGTAAELCPSADAGSGVVSCRCVRFQRRRSSPFWMPLTKASYSESVNGCGALLVFLELRRATTPWSRKVIWTRLVPPLLVCQLALRSWDSIQAGSGSFLFRQGP